MHIDGLAYMDIDKGFPAAIQGACKLSVVRNVPNIDLV
jgi:hypothetical protein